MNYPELEKILLQFDEARLSFPFDNKTAVFKVSNKMFALVSINKEPLSINLKCDPEDALILRAQFYSVTPGYHMNKEHWNTVCLDGSIDPNLLLKLIDDSYRLVIKTLNKEEQKRLGFE